MKLERLRYGTVHTQWLTDLHVRLRSVRTRDAGVVDVGPASEHVFELLSVAFWTRGRCSGHGGKDSPQMTSAQLNQTTTA